MKLIELFNTAKGNLFRAKLRSWLTITAIFIGSFTLTITNGIGAGISAYVDSQIGNLGNATTVTIEGASAEDDGPPIGGDPQKYDPQKKLSAPSGGFAPQEVLLTHNDLEIVKQQPHIDDAFFGHMIIVDYIENNVGERYRINIGAASGRTVELETGRLPSDLSAEATFTLPSNFVPVLGFDSPEAALGQTLTFGINDTTGKNHEVSAIVAAVQTPTLLGSHTALGNKALLDQLYEAQSTGLPPKNRTSTFIIARLSSQLTPKEFETLHADFKALGYSATTFDDELGIFKQVIDFAIIVLNIFAGIVLVAAAFGIINTLLMAVQERTREIGLLRALGLSRQKIFILFSTEAVLLGVVGSLLGIVVGIIVGLLSNIAGRNTILADFDGFSLVIFPIETVLLIFITIISLSFLAGTLPAWRASQQDAISALRHE